MKNLGLFLCLALLSAAMSCTKESEGPQSAPEREEVELTICIAAGQTRAAAGTYSEDEIKSLQVFVFSGDNLELMRYSQTDTVKLRCFEGSKDIYVIVNHSEIEWTPGMTGSDLMDTVVELKDDFGWNVMFGHSKKSISSGGLPADGSGLVTVSVKRVAARIVLTRISGRNASNTLTLKRAYITNVAGDADLYATSSGYTRPPDIWHNRAGRDKDADDIIYSGELSATVSGMKSVEVNQYFYCYPNPTTDDTTINEDLVEWTPRYTRLVAEIEYNGVLYYYVVSIGGVQSGHSYEVGYSIEGIGASDPEGNYASGSKSVTAVSCKGQTGGARDDLHDSEVSVIRFQGGYAEMRECAL